MRPRGCAVEGCSCTGRRTQTLICICHEKMLKPEVVKEINRRWRAWRRAVEESVMALEVAGLKHAGDEMPSIYPTHVHGLPRDLGPSLLLERKR